MSRLMSEPRKLVFNPDDSTSDGYGVGIKFDSYGKVFLFVGSVEIDSVPQKALAVLDYSHGRFLKEVSAHSEFAVSRSAFVNVDERHLIANNHSTPVIATYDQQAIVNILSQVREHQGSDFSAALDDMLQAAQKAMTPE